VIGPLDRVLVLVRAFVGALRRREAMPGEIERARSERDAAVESRRWAAALTLQEHLISLVAAPERPREAEWLAALHYERGREELARGNASGATGHFRSALRSDRHFLPAQVALGDALQAGGDRREAVRTWERAVETDPARSLLVRLERAYREEGRPSRMIALYRAAAERAPDDLPLALELGRVYFDLEMLDEAADQFEKIEVRAPDLPVVHAFLGAVFEHRGETVEAFAEYRRALRLAGAFGVTYRCQNCRSVTPEWTDRCPRCGRWNTMRATVEG